MQIRHSDKNDLPAMLAIYERARVFMTEHGNPRQWGATHWPPEALLLSDIARKKSYVCLNEEGEVIGTFFFDSDFDIEPTYRKIEGAWLEESDFGVVHRLASAGSEKGVGAFCLDWAYARCGHLRVDTHGDNTVMQSLLRKLGFRETGVIHVEEDDDPRIAFEKLPDTAILR